MATRSTIIVRQEKVYKVISVHWDGYLEGVGAVLKKHYTKPAKLKKLVGLGDLSILAPKINKPEGHDFNNPKKGYSVAYGRDRGERNTEAKVYLMPEMARQDYNRDYTYLWDGSKWLYKTWCKDDWEVL